ncbi:hypothetical protein SAMN05216490_4517 [Mucilaginibacter mallensis]|uniref:Uncharacterized protein n=1 Tax=Mucilaginibacter mallensis TaxID=652787 RepID=A0A1H2C0U2_MUCMA|nr:hypothetical protein [Mucilaginibacter mallensis]SDT64033.1 hypothetical protein SAMN05216490_4517 [Mucilaginibacter mallensis]
MDLTIIYKDENSRVITEEQAAFLTEYTVITLKNGAVKKKEWLVKRREGDLKAVEYYLDSSESKTEVIKYYQDDKIAITIYFNSESSNGFTLWNFEQYGKDGTLKFKGYTVYNEKHWDVMNCEIDLYSGDLLKCGRKYYYGNQFPNQYDDLLLKFDYNADGSLNEISDFNDNYDFNQGPVQLESFLSHMKALNQEFIWDKHSYFHSLKPYLPETKNL